MRIAVIGASGYTGLELVRLLLAHSEAELSVVTSEQRAGEDFGAAFPAFRGQLDLRLEAADPASIPGRADLAFCALPHGTSAPVVSALRERGLPVVDLSADFRLEDRDVYRAWYGEHKAPELFGEGVYGLPELHRQAIVGAPLVAAPGCYPTSVLLPLAPFLRAGRIETDALHIDAKSGVSGAGRKLDAGFLLGELAENCHAYGVGRHRHVPEIEQEAHHLAGSEVRVSFVPHLLPIARGMATSIFARPKGALAVEEAHGLLAEAYRDEPFVRVLPSGEVPKLASVRGSNFCDVACFVDPSTGSLILLSALDNLTKGASGQAIQCMNLMCGFEETEGLRGAPWPP